MIETIYFLSIVLFRSCFLQKISIENRKETKGRKKAYHSYHYSLGYCYIKQRSVLPVTAVICSRDWPCFGRHIPPQFYSITKKAAGSEVLVQVLLCRVRSWCISQEDQVGHEQINTKQTKIFRPNYFCIFNLHRRMKTVCFQIHNVQGSIQKLYEHQKCKNVHSLKSSWGLVLGGP